MISPIQNSTFNFAAPNWFERLEGLEAEWVAIERKQEPDPQFWRWSPTPLPKVRVMMAIADMYRGIAELETEPKFFDAGCGIGTKMAVAEWEFGWDAYGWDLYPEYIRVATDQLGMANARVANLRNEEPIWHAYDIVMISRPFKDDAEQEAWERKVQTQMRPGAVLIATHAAVKPYSWRWLYRAPWRIVAVKPMPGEPDHTGVNAPGLSPGHS